MKIVALSDSLAPWHSFWIRIGQYLPALPWPTEISDNPAAIRGLGAGDRLIVYRYALGWGNLAAALRDARQRGVVILSDLDDYLWQANGWSRERLLGCTRALRECQILTCSTEPLLHQLQVMFPQQRLLLIPNSAPKLKQTPQKSPCTPLRIGWTGAPWTRPSDLALLTPLAEWIAARPHQVQLMHVGHGEGRLSLADALGLSNEQVLQVPLQGHSSYMEQLQFQIGLAPLAPTSFNHYKSAIKVIEYSAVGIPWLASNAEPYRSLCSQWNWNGRLCDQGSDWIAHLQPLLNENKRQEEGALLKQLCNQHCSYEAAVALWFSLLDRPAPQALKP